MTDEREFVGAPLTPEEIREMEEIYRDKTSVDDVLAIAMNYAANRLTKLRELETAWWDKVVAVRGLPNDPRYRVDCKGPIVRIEKTGEKA